MEKISPLPSKLNVEPLRFTVVLFSQPGCEFCAEVREHYLRPLMSSRTRLAAIAEADVESSELIRDWSGREVTQREFARTCGVRFAPTIMFFDAQGRSLADPIVGLSKDFFGAYLDQRIETAVKASRKIRRE